MKTKLALAILLLTLFFCFEKGMAQAPPWQWAKSASGINPDWGTDIACDASGNVLVTGFFSNPAITFDTTTLTTAGSSDIFIVKYDAMGNMLWVKSAGGISDEYGTGICTDASGNVLVTGSFNSPSITFDTTALTNSGSQDIFVAKYDASGNFLWATSVGGSDFETGYDISTDVNANVVITGFFESSSMTLGTTTLTNADSGSADILIAKYDAAGNFLWAKSAGGALDGSGMGITTDASANVLVTSNFQSDSVTFGTTVLTKAGMSDMFIVKYDTAGNVLWAKSAGGISGETGHGISTDVSGNILVTGYFQSDALTFGTATLTNADTSGYDIFIVKYDASGNVLWAKSAGGTSNDFAYANFIDVNGNALVTGNFASDSITFGTTTLSNVTPPYNDMYIAKYDASGNVLWAKSAGGTYYDSGQGIFTDGNGNVLVTGYFHSPSITFGTTTILNTSGNYDYFIAKLDNTTGIVDGTTPFSMTSVFPNPATDYLTINTYSNKKQVITIRDITGQLIYSATTMADKTIIKTIDFPQGVYAVQVQAGNAVETRKVVVTR